MEKGGASPFFMYNRHPVHEMRSPLAPDGRNPRQFFRANRQYIVAHKAVTGVSLWFGGRMVLQLTPPTDEKVLISKARVPAFREWF